MNDLYTLSLLLEHGAPLVAFMAGALVGPLLAHLVEHLIARRRQRKLDEATDYLMRVGFLEADRRGWIPEDLQ